MMVEKLSEGFGFGMITGSIFVLLLTQTNHMRWSFGWLGLAGVLFIGYMGRVHYKEFWKDK